MKMQKWKKNPWDGCPVGGRLGEGGQGGYERRIEVTVEMQKKAGGGGQGGCEQSIEVIVKNAKNVGVGGCQGGC